MIGKIIKGIAGFYYVSYKENIYECKAKGVFRNQNIKPLVGDEVIFDVLDEAKKIGNIIEIKDRKNQMIRPAISNIDMLLVILAIKKPAPKLYLLDKYLISMADIGIDIAIVFNKLDLLDKGDVKYTNIYENAGYTCIETSVNDSKSIEKLKEFIIGKSVAFAGPSGVGKSSITNVLCPKAFMETNTISRKIERGRHTTRHSEFFYVDDNTYLCDTPGFTSVDISNIKKEELRDYYREFVEYQSECRFNGCIHINEPDCKVKEAVEHNKISKIRYENYVKIYEELDTMSSRFKTNGKK